jgi:transcriptional regulator with XRE-family HTH domain
MANETMTPRQFLARELRRAREVKGLSTTDVAKAVFVTERLVRYWENGGRLPKPDDMARLDELYGTAGYLGRFRDDLVTAPVPVEWFGKWPRIEQKARSLWTFLPMVMPGLLQTEDYARATLKAANHIADLEEMVSARLERQDVLTKEDPPTYVALIAECVLRTLVGSARIMHEQVTHLVEAADRDNIILQIVPARAPKAGAGYTGQIVIASFDGNPDVAYVDDALEGRVVTDSDDVTRLHRMFDNFRADALSQGESKRFILEVLKEWKN